MAAARLLEKKEGDKALMALDGLLQTYGPSQHTGIRQTLAQAWLEKIYLWHWERIEPPEGSSAVEQAAAVCQQMEAHFSDTDSVLEVHCLGRCLQLHAEALRKQAEQQTRDEESEHCQDGAALIAEAQALSAQHWQRNGQHTDALVRIQPTMQRMHAGHAGVCPG